MVKVDKYVEIFKNRAEALKETEERKLKKSNRRDALLLGIPAVLMVTVAIIWALVGKWVSAGYGGVVSMYMLLTILNNRIINRQRYTINMLVGIREIDDDVKELIRRDQDASTNAKRNRKK